MTDLTNSPTTTGPTEGADSLEWLRPLIDHTLLSPEATTQQVEDHLREARALGLSSICINPSMLPIEKDGLRVVAVCGFPSGAHRPEVKALEATLALADGADEIDMVINIGAVKSADWDTVRADVSAVRAVVPSDRKLKVIIESAVLSDAEIIECCRIAEELKVDFVKTSTGFHPAGGATLEAVRLMSTALDGRLQIKASGGIRALHDAVALTHAGATRLGLSSTRRILTGAPTGTGGTY